MLHHRRILILPASNTLSHVAQALAIAERLESQGMECHLALARVRAAWASQFHPRCHEISELWQPSGMPFPCPRWFSDRAYVERCLASREDLIERLQPALVIGIFDFLCKASARELPVIAINGACMLPWFNGVLGCDETDTSIRREQKRTMYRFWEFAARAVAPSLRRRNLPAPQRANELLVGDHNYIYEIRELCGVPELPQDWHAIGPIVWPGWERVGESPPWERSDGEATVYVSAGTLAIDAGALERLLDQVCRLGVRVVASTGQAGAGRTNERLFCRPFLAPAKTTAAADLVVCTGGIGVCYQNLASRVPSLVVPMQPEQATNGIHLQRQGCGRVLLPEVVFTGHSHQYAEAINYELFSANLRDMLDRRASFAAPLQRIAQCLAACDALEAIARCASNLL